MKRSARLFWDAVGLHHVCSTHIRKAPFYGHPQVPKRHFSLPVKHGWKSVNRLQIGLKKEAKYSSVLQECSTFFNEVEHFFVFVTGQSPSLLGMDEMLQE